MKAADLKYSIEIYKPVVTVSDFGRTIVKYEHRCTTRARVNYLSGSRIMENEEIFYSVDREFIVRSYVPVEYDDIIKFDGQDWQVLSIDKIHEYNDIVIRTTRLMSPVPMSSTGAVAPIIDSYEKWLV